MSTKQEVAGVIGFFEGPEALLAAAAKTRDANVGTFDVFSPYPIHGMDEAQGVKPSLVPYVTLVAGLLGCLFAYGLESWTSSVDWPLNVGGKPFNSIPAWVPVMFECTVLFAGISTLLAMLYFNRFPNVKKKIFDPGITRDRFALVIETPEFESEHQEFHGSVRPQDEADLKGDASSFSESKAADFLKQIGAQEVRTVYTEGWFS